MPSATLRFAEVWQLPVQTGGEEGEKRLWEHLLRKHARSEQEMSNDK